MLIVPGLDGEGHLFHPFVKRLADAGIEAVLIGHCDDDEWKVPQQAAGALLRRLEDAAAARAGAEIIVIGESFGSNTALQFARGNERIAGLIVCGGFAFLPFAWRRKLLLLYPLFTVGARLLPAITLSTLTRLIRPLTRRKDPDWIKAAALEMRVPSASCLLGKIKLAMDFDARPWLHEIRVPTHVIAGTGDLTVPPACANALAERIPGAQLHLLPQLGHLAHHADPDILWKCTMRLLGR